MKLKAKKVPSYDDLRKSAEETLAKDDRLQKAHLCQFAGYLGMGLILLGLVAVIFGGCKLARPESDDNYKPTVAPIGNSQLIPAQEVGFKEDLLFPPTYRIEGLSSPSSTTLTALWYGTFSAGVAIIAIGISILPNFRVSDQERMVATIFLQITKPEASSVKEDEGVNGGQPDEDEYGPYRRPRPNR
ncbi:hypothetical protein ACTXIX_03860 [Glutamicibacter ardleyensis]|uniref:hypothetical protein n=1 Tax=Glutamicibacter ardleyensis TaxID=225894 RepID=UPI003FD55E97